MAVKEINLKLEDLFQLDENVPHRDIILRCQDDLWNSIAEIEPYVKEFFDNLTSDEKTAGKTRPVSSGEELEGLEVSSSSHIENATVLTRGKCRILQQTSLSGRLWLFDGSTVGPQVAIDGVVWAEPNVKILEHTSIRGSLYLGEGTIIGPNVVAEGLNIIGRNCHVGPFTHLRGNVILGDHAMTNMVQIKNSYILDAPQNESQTQSKIIRGTAINHGHYVGDSIVGRGVNLGSGFDTANLKISEGPISPIGGKGTEYGNKLGCLIGDHVSIQCHCVTDPGMVIGKYSQIINNGVDDYVPPFHRLNRKGKLVRRRDV